MGINIKLLQVLVTIQLERKLSSTDVVLNVKVSRHGPVMNGLITGLDNNEPVAMSWFIHNKFIFSMRFTLFHMQKTKQIFKRGLLYFSLR
jgi:penicillin amidase